VADGEVVGLIGPNGAGKTTLLSRSRPHAGESADLIEGRPLPGETRREVIFIFQTDPARWRSIRGGGDGVLRRQYRRSAEDFYDVVQTSDWGQCC